MILLANSCYLTLEFKLPKLSFSTGGNVSSRNQWFLILVPPSWTEWTSYGNCDDLGAKYCGKLHVIEHRSCEWHKRSEDGFCELTNDDCKLDGKKSPIELRDVACSPEIEGDSIFFSEKPASKKYHQFVEKILQ